MPKTKRGKSRHIFWMTFIKDRKSSLSAKIVIFLALICIKVFYPQYIDAHKWIEIPLNLLFYYMLLSIVFNYVRINLIALYYKRNNIPPGHYDDVVIIINRTSFLINHVLFLAIALWIIGLSLTTILTSVGLFAAALALIFKEPITNFICGINVIFSKNIDIRNYMRIGEYEGRIVDVSFMFTKLLTSKGEEVYIPNNYILTKEFVNLSKIKHKTVELDFYLQYKFHSKIDLLESLIIEKIFKKFKNNLRKSDIEMKIINIDYKRIQLRFEFNIGKYNYELDKDLRKECNREILKFISQYDKTLKNNN